MERSTQKMRLAPFIREHQERILEEFEEFARTYTKSGGTMDTAALRDHAADMLSTIALDMERAQSEAERALKSRGLAPGDGNAAHTAAERHGTDRADSGFSLPEMFSEYRALRATVLRLWTVEHGAMDEQDLHDMIRFNEAIDMAMAESISTFSAVVDRAREMFLAVLGHDLRSPMNAIVAGSSFLVTRGGLAGRALRVAERVYSSGKRMDGLLSDLVDFTRCRVGMGISFTPEDVDLAEIGRDLVDEYQTTHPTVELRFEVSGNVRGEWDPIRVTQAVSNLVGNAVQHGDASAPIVVAAREEADGVVVSVHNHGSMISPEDQEIIFEPFTRVVSGENRRPRQRSSGLGLYIAEQIALKHGGAITVRSTVEEGTTFELSLPRHVPSAARAREATPLDRVTGPAQGEGVLPPWRSAATPDASHIRNSLLQKAP